MNIMNIIMNISFINSNCFDIYTCLDFSPILSPRSVATRLATLIADKRLGCVTKIFVEPP